MLLDHYSTHEIWIQKLLLNKSPAPPPLNQGLDPPLWLSEAHWHLRNLWYICIHFNHFEKHKSKKKMTKIGRGAFPHPKFMLHFQTFPVSADYELLGILSNELQSSLSNQHSLWAQFVHTTLQISKQILGSRHMPEPSYIQTHWGAQIRCGVNPNMNKRWCGLNHKRASAKS